MPSTLVDLERPCELCGSAKGRVLSLAGRGGAPLRTVVCPDCGLVFSDPAPHDVRDFYERSYRLDYKGVGVPKLKHVLRAGLVALHRRKRLGAALAPGARLLDIGSGGGEFLLLMDRLGLAAKGVEPNLGYAGYSRDELGLDVSVGFIEDVDHPPGTLDLVTVWHVLEHTRSPGEILGRLGSFLAEGGRLIVEVPNVKAVSQAPASTFHPAHLYTFGAETLSALMAKAGLVPESVLASHDLGNLTIVARRGSPGDPAPAGLPYDGPAEARAVQALVGGRSLARHLLSPWPYRRAWGRLTRALSERWRLRGLTDRPGVRRAILERLYQGEIGR